MKKQIEESLHVEALELIEQLLDERHWWDEDPTSSLCKYCGEVDSDGTCCMRVCPSCAETGRAHERCKCDEG